MGLFSNTINITGSNNLNPIFQWQVGFKDKNVSIPSLQFRATVRPLTENEGFNRLPNATVLYEETGIKINNVDNLGTWGFPLSTNAAIVGGPYRDYQVVIEAHDENGNTSAGNIVGTSDEDGFAGNPYGYDIVAFSNPRQTGIELSNALPTQPYDGSDLTRNTGTHETRQFIGGNGELTIRFTSGTFDEDLVGAFIYSSLTPFPKREALQQIGYWGSHVQKSQTSFDPTNPYISHPTACFNIRGCPYGFISVSLYDTLDKESLDNGFDISTGLYLSDNCLVTSDSAGASFSIAGIGTIMSVMVTGYVSPYDLRNSSYVSGIIGSGSVAITANSTSPNDIPSTLSTILYWSTPFSGLTFTGSRGGILGQGQYIGGIGNNAVTDGTVNITPGGWNTGHRILMADGSYKNLCDIQLGDSVRSYFPTGVYSSEPIYDYALDNWKTYENSRIRAPSYAHLSSTVTKIFTGIVNSYYRISKQDSSPPQAYNNHVLTGTYDQILFMEDASNMTSQNPRKYIHIAQILTEYRLKTFHRTEGSNHSLSDKNILINLVTTEELPLTVYSLQVEPYRNYVLSGAFMLGNQPDNRSGIVVHNAVTRY